MKTVAELNEKWWYRLLKVTFAIAFIFSVFVAVALVFNEMRPYEVLDLDKSKLICKNPNGSLNFSVSFTEVNKSEGSMYAYQNLEKDWDRDDLIAELCNITIPTVTNKSGFSNREYTVKKDGWREMVLSLHSLEKVNKTIGSYWLMFLFILITLFAIVISFEIVRRTFYYIVLGSLRPKIK